MKKGQWWIERILQWCIVITGAYIIYRGTGIMVETGWLKSVIGSGKTAEVLQEITIQTYLPGYAAAFENLSEENPLHKWMEQFVPVLQEWYEEVVTVQMEHRNDAAIEEENGVITEAEKTEEREGITEAVMTEESEVITETVTQLERITEKSAEQEAENDQKEIMSRSVSELSNFDYLLQHYFVVDSDTAVDEGILDAEQLLSMDLSIEEKTEEPQILIYHTHSQEAFLDSENGKKEHTIVGMGTYLEQLLEERYGYQVIHDCSEYDFVNGVLDRSAAYDYARAGIEKILEEHPTIEVVLDLHRDGVEGKHFVTEINGKQTAQIMFFNGLSRDSEGTQLHYLQNPYLQENLAFSFQLQLEAEKRYPGFARKIYLKGQRFNLHLKPRSLLIEAGTQLNTVEEERNAMEVLAELLDSVLKV